MAAAAITRDNIRPLLVSKREVSKLAAVQRLLGGADGQVLSGLFVRVKSGQYDLAQVQQLSDYEGKQLLVVQLPTDRRGLDGTQVRVNRCVPLTTVSGTNSLEDANWEALGRAELERLAAYMQGHGLELPLEEVAGSAWRKQAALAWHAQHGAAPPAVQQQHLPALLQQLADAAGIAGMQQRLEAAETSPRRQQQVAFTVSLPQQQAAGPAGPAPPQPAAAAAAVSGAAVQPQAAAAPPGRQVEYHPPSLPPAVAFQMPQQAAMLPSTAAGAAPPSAQQAFHPAGAAAWQAPYMSAPLPLFHPMAGQRHATCAGSNQLEAALPVGGQLQREVSATAGGLQISVSGIAAHAHPLVRTAAASAALQQPAQQLAWQHLQQQAQQWVQAPLLAQQQLDWGQRNTGGMPQATAFELPPHLRRPDEGSGAVQHAAPQLARRPPLAELLVPRIPSFSSITLPGIAVLDEAVAALAAAARQAVPDSPTAAAQHALIVGLVRRQLKPYGDRSFRQYSAKYKEAMEVMAQASLASGAVKQSYNTYPGRRLDGLVADLADWGLLSVAGKGGQPTEVLLHADRLVSIRHSGLGPRPVPGSMGGSPLGGRSRGRDGQGSPQRERATAADRQQAAGGSGAAAEPGAQLVPYLARHGSNGEPEYELIGRQLLLSGLPRAWQRDELRVQALVEGTGARVSILKCTPGDDERGDLAHVHCKSAADAARAAERLGGKELEGSRLVARSKQREVQDLLHDPAVAEAADKALAAAKAAAQAGAAAKAASKPAGDTAQAAGGRGRPHSRSHERSSGRNRRGRSRSAKRRRSRSRGARAAPAEGGGPFRGLPEDAPLVPVQLVHVSGNVGWKLCGNDVFVSGLGYGERNLLRERLEAAFAETGIPVTYARVLEGDDRGRIAYVNVRPAVEAARAIERLQQHMLVDRPLFLRPVKNNVDLIKKTCPSAALAAASRALEACVAEERQRRRPGADVRSSSRGRRRSGSRSSSRGRGKDARRGRSGSSRDRPRNGSYGRRRRSSGERPRDASRGRSSSRSGRGRQERGRGSSRRRKRSRSRSSEEQQQRRQRQWRSPGGELATPERSPSPADTAEQGRGASQTPERSPPFE